MVYRADPEEKYDLLKRTLILENPESCMIFCGTRKMVNVLLQKLKRDRIFCGCLLYTSSEEMIDAAGDMNVKMIIAWGESQARTGMSISETL